MTAGAEAGDKIRIACWVLPDELPSCSRMPCFFVRVIVDGIASVREASTTEYCRSQTNSTSSRGDADETPARRTCEDPNESREISPLNEGVDSEEKERLRNVTGLHAGAITTLEFSKHSIWKQCHSPEGAAKTVSLLNE